MDADIVSEQWRPVIGFEGRYEISSIGRIRSIRRRTTNGIRGGIILNQQTDRDGYRYLVISNHDGQQFLKRIQRLVAEAFIGPIPEGFVVCHNNGIRSDNSVDNLRIDTQRSNVMDCKTHGTCRVGVLHVMAKLTENQVREIRERRKQGETFQAIANDYGVKRTAVSAIVHRRTWRHVP